jgi:hypothetical protein
MSSRKNETEEYGYAEFGGHIDTESGGSSRTSSVHQNNEDKHLRESVILVAFLIVGAAHVHLMLLPKKNHATFMGSI